MTMTRSAGRPGRIILLRPADGEAENLLAALNLKPPTAMGRSGDALAPLVILTGALRLLRKMRMISPKPRVTMAR